VLCEHDFDVARLALDPRRAALSAGTNSPHARTLVDADPVDDEVVDVDPRVVAAVLLLGIGQSRPHQLRQRLGKSPG
jgi:hypothetical protein